MSADRRQCATEVLSHDPGAPSRASGASGCGSVADQPRAGRCGGVRSVIAGDPTSTAHGRIAQRSPACPEPVPLHLKTVEGNLRGFESLSLRSLVSMIYVLQLGRRDLDCASHCAIPSYFFSERTCRRPVTTSLLRGLADSRHHPRISATAATAQ